MNGDEELDLLDLELRQVPEVMAVGFEWDDGILHIQLLLTDPAAQSTVRERATQIVQRLVEQPCSIETRAAGAPHRPLAFETVVSGLSEVRSCVAERGPRGEVLSIAVTVTSLRAIEEAMDRLSGCLGASFPEERVWVDLIPAG